MIITGKHLHRRTFLKGIGAAIALPMLDAMHPALANAANTPATPVRLAFNYIPNGVTMKSWKPAATGADFAFTPILKPLEAHRKDLFVLSGLDHHNAESLGDGGGDHARAGGCYLTGVHPRKTAGADIQAGISVDQIAAAKLGANTRLASLELGCEDSRTVGVCDSGYSCAYTNSISWRGPKTPLPPETNPRLIFERLFGDQDFSLSPADRAAKLQQRRSILDVVNTRTKRLSQDLGPSDRRKLDEYLAGIQEIEKRIRMAETSHDEFTPTIEKPSGIPVAYADYLKLMFDLQVLAFQADLTRVSTLVYGREASVRTYNEVGVADPHHPLSHHRNLPENMDKLQKINTFHTTLFASFLDKMKAVKEGDGNLLDHSVVVYGGGICDGNSHSHNDLPLLLAGSANGRFKPGRHIAYEKGTPMTNLFLTILDKVDVPTEKLGDSNGQLQHLSDI